MLRHAAPALPSLAALLSTFYAPAWAACKDAMRRRSGFTAAFVATCLHPALFDITDPQDERWVALGIASLSSRLV